MTHNYSNTKGQCFIHHTFGTCKYDDAKYPNTKCPYLHEGNICGYDFFVGKIISEIPREGGDVILRESGQTDNKILHISGDAWFRADAKRGDWALMQKSHKLHQGKNFVRVILVLCGGSSGDETQSIDVHRVEYAFTIDAAETNIRDDAISVDKCEDHENCQKVGIHVIAVNGRDKIRANEIERYGVKWRKNWMDKGMNKGKRYPTLSVFFHTQSKDVSGLVLSVVRVTENCEFGKFPREEWRDLLWDYFADAHLRNKLLSTGLYRCALGYPRNLWRDVVILECLIKKYSKLVKNFAPSKKINLITNLVINLKHIKLSRIPAFDDECPKVTATDVVVPFMSRMIQFLKPCRDVKDHFPLRYQSNVESSPGKNNVVKCTSPLVKFKHYLNQQILTRYVANPSAQPLYSREDLLGLLVPRFQTPSLTKVIFTGFNEDGSLVLEYNCEQKVDPALYAYSISELHRPEVNHCGIAKIHYADLWCDDEDYCNRKLVYFEYDVFEELENKWKKGENLKEVLQRLNREKSKPLLSPYSREDKDTGTTLALEHGAELQVQISTYDAKDHGISLGLRMLRIGRNCHLCFTHVNYPDKAFMSDRSDVHQLITNETIITLQRATTNEILKSSEHITAKIRWFGDYMGGGSFDVNYFQHVDNRDLLCIRKEILDEVLNLRYIWCCHGIINDVTGNTVEFATCTVSQLEDLSQLEYLSQLEDLIGNTHFQVAIISPDEVKSKVTARETAATAATMKRRNTL